MQAMQRLSAVIGSDLAVVSRASPPKGYCISVGTQVFARGSSLEGKDNEMLLESTDYSWKLITSRWRARVSVFQLDRPNRRGTLDIDCLGWPTHATVRFDDGALFKWHPTELSCPEYGFSAESGSLLATFGFDTPDRGTVRLIAETVSEQHLYMLLFLGIHLAMRI